MPRSSKFKAFVTKVDRQYIAPIGHKVKELGSRVKKSLLVKLRRNQSVGGSPYGLQNCNLEIGYPYDPVHVFAFEYHHERLFKFYLFESLEQLPRLSLEDEHGFKCTTED
jgi:hypothetical protein